MLARFKISTKVVAIVCALAAICTVISVTGVTSLQSLSEATNEMEVAAGESVAATRMRQTVLRLNGTEFRVAAELTEDNLKASRQIVDEQVAEFGERMARLATTADAEQRRLLDDVQATFDIYLDNLHHTLTAAERHAGTDQLSAAQLEVSGEAMSSLAEAEALEQAIVRFTEYTMAKASAVSNDATAEYESSSTMIMVIAGLGVVGGLVLGWTVSRVGIISPIRAIVAGLRELAGGNLRVDVYGLERKDEIGEIAQTMQVFKDNALEIERLKDEQVEAENRAAEEKRRAMDDLARRFEASVGGIVGTLSSAANEMQATAQSMSATAEETSQQATAVAAASEQASANVQTVASAAEQLSGSVSEIGRQVVQSSAIAGKAVAEAERTNATVKGLAEAANRVGAVVDLINQIAAQTNLLALNATIEAARAGDAGKGFAVVASEVKTLANQTARATEEIASQIQAMQGATGEAVVAIETIGTTIAEIEKIATAIASAVEEQGAATEEIARNVQQASQGTQEVSSNISGVTDAAGATGAAASQVLGAAGDLAKQGESLRTEVDRFLEAVRAA
ncbi:MAG: methyl-accepting chemotaxis protein [Alphaproteobacteria bacterium]